MNKRPAIQLNAAALSWRVLFYVLLGGLFGLLPTWRAQAHGGVIIDSGFVEQYEWLVALNPYPATTGDLAVSLQVYDVDTYQPMNGLDVVVFLAPPGDVNPCCGEEQHIGPLPVDVQPVEYPGDYSAFLRLSDAGTWQIQYRVKSAESEFSIVTSFDVGESAANQPRPTIVGAIQVSANGETIIPTATPVTVSTLAEVSALTSPLTLEGQAPTEAAQEALPAPRPPQAESTSGQPGQRQAEDVTAAVRSSFWLWGIAGLVPVVLLVLWFLRTPTDASLHTPPDTSPDASSERASAQKDENAL